MKFGKDYGNRWDTWFAWHPIKIGTQWFWLETVEAHYNLYWENWSYREIPKQV